MKVVLKVIFSIGKAIFHAMRWIFNHTINAKRYQARIEAEARKARKAAKQAEYRQHVKILEQQARYEVAEWLDQLSMDLLSYARSANNPSDCRYRASQASMWSAAIPNMKRTEFMTFYRELQEAWQRGELQIDYASL